MTSSTSTDQNGMHDARANQVKRAFYLHTSIDMNRALDKIEEINLYDIVKSFFKNKNPDCELTDFNRPDEASDKLKREFTCVYWSDSKMIGIVEGSNDFLDDIRSQIPRHYAGMVNARQMLVDGILTAQVKGELEVTNHTITNLQLTYEQAAVTFFANYEFKYSVSAALNQLISGNYGPREIIREGVHAQQYRSWSVPLAVLRVWMKGKIEDSTERIEKPSAIDNAYIYYGSQRYPIWLFELIQSFGNQTFKVFYDAGFVKKIVYDLISEGIPEQQVPQISSNLKSSTVLEPNVKEQDPELERLEQLVEIKTKDKERLMIIHGTVNPHKERAWAGILRFSGTGGSGPFIKRMTNAGLIRKETASGNGFWLRLTDKAMRILDLRT